MKNNKISIITVCYNSSSTIRDTIESVLSQTYDNYEYIIVDGKSSDNTLEIIKSYESKFNGKLRYISEKDNGIYDAMNKGINMSSGNIIGIINSDDIIHDKDAFKKIAGVFLENDCDIVYSDLYMMDNETMTKIKRVFKAGKGNYKFGWFPPHPTMYVRKNVYDTYGKFDTKFRIAADYDFMLRIMKNKVIMYYIKETLIYMRSGGVSTKSFKAYFKSFKESIVVLKNNKIRFPYFVNMLRVFRICCQIIKGFFNLFIFTLM